VALERLRYLGEFQSGDGRGDFDDFYVREDKSLPLPLSSGEQFLFQIPERGILVGGFGFIGQQRRCHRPPSPSGGNSTPSHRKKTQSSSSSLDGIKLIERFLPAHLMFTQLPIIFICRPQLMVD
jgi:hypothetical protein